MIFLFQVDIPHPEEFSPEAPVEEIPEEDVFDESVINETHLLEDELGEESEIHDEEHEETEPTKKRGGVSARRTLSTLMRKRAQQQRVRKGF